jgi:histidinol-phosphate aminotransferase
VRGVLDHARPAITFLCTPNNPTGLVEPRETVEAVLAAAPGLVVVDEAYAQFAPWSALSLLAPDRPLAVTRTYSKTWSMAALRLGYLIAPPEVVEACERVLLPYHLDAATQVAGRLALRWQGEMEARVAAIVAERERLTEALRRLPVDVFPSGANFVLFRPRPASAAESGGTASAAESGGTASADALAVWKGLVERSVLVRDCSSWPRLSGCLRVTIGMPEENHAFLAALTEVLA